MSKIQVVEGYRVGGRHEVVGSEAAAAQGYVKEFTRHSNDVLLNLNELRHQNILTDATLVVGTARLQAHCAVLIACRLVQRIIFIAIFLVFLLLLFLFLFYFARGGGCAVGLFYS